MSRFERCVIQLLVLIANRVARGSSRSDNLDIDKEGWPTYGGEPL